MKLLLFFCLFSTALTAQPLQGHWKGELTQQTGGVTERYHFELFIRQTPDSIVGKSLIANVDNPEVSGELLLRGTWDEPVFRFLEHKILPSRRTINPPNFCMKKARLTYTHEETAEVLKGTWEGVSPVYGRCAPGTIHLSKRSTELPEDALPKAPEPPEEKRIVFGGKELREGSSVQLEAINFAPTSAKLRDTKALEKLLDFLQTNPRVHIELSGHTDRNPEKSHPGYQRIRQMHVQLAKDRLQAVLMFLKENKIDTERITTVAYGGERPLVAENSSRNRRVEMKIIKID